MNRALLSLSLLSITVACKTGGAALAPRPNVIVIMTDDQGLGDLGCLGNPVLATPNIDRLAAASARVERFYVSPVCTPTRASLLTGRHSYRTRAIDTWVGRAMMEPDEVTMAEVLRTAGFRTGIFGKWHLGDCYPMRAIDQGFDTALVHRGGGLAQPSEPRENDRRYTDPILFRNGAAVQTSGFCTDVYFDAAIDFVRAAGEQPFFAYVATNAPHTPLHDVPPDLYARYAASDLSAVLPAAANAQQRDAVARVFAMIENIDRNMGRLLATLEATGAADNTIVIYLHDNGHQQPRWCRGLRGTKGTVYEGGIRSPLFVRWPGHLAPGAVVGEPAAHIDVLPTVLDFVGLDAPACDGQSLRPLLERRSESLGARHLVLQVHRGDVPVRGHHVAVIGPRYKLVHPTGFGRESPPADVAWELYDLQTDPGEQRDLAPGDRARVGRMRAAYDRWFDDVSTTRPDNFAPPRIVVGTDHETETALTRQDWRRYDRRGWGNRGRWLLRFDGEHRYDLRVILTQPIGAAQAVLRIGELQRQRAVAAEVAEFDFSDVAVPAGEGSLELAITHAAGTVAPYQVIVTRR